jgi:hypothetical protein
MPLIYFDFVNYYKIFAKKIEIMKKVLLMCAASLMMVATYSCKKGENDPFLSLKSRDARIVGEWTLESQESTSTSTTSFDGDTYTSLTTTKFDGTVYTSTETADGETNTNTFSYSYKVNIMKDGTYELTTVADGNTSKTTGSWWWTSDAKKKTRIAFDDDLDSYEIDMLKSKEMTWIMSNEYSNNSSGFSSTSMSSGTMTFSK